MKNTKTKLISSVIVLLICFAMLIGSTFAWFTDSASTGVNKIQAGNLDIEIVSPDDHQTPLETLEWLKTSGAESETVLWEPGVTYKLTTFEVKNVGDLALKFKMNISVGNESVNNVGDTEFKLSDVISWKIYTNDSIDGNESASLYDAFDKEKVYKLEATKSKVFSILATMDTGAGNEYKNLSMDSITVDVIAAQYTFENDSFGNQYDANAQYPVVAVASVQVDENKKVTSEVKVSTAETVGSSSQPVATLTVPTNVVTDGSGSLTMSVTETNTPENVTNAIAVTSNTRTLEVKVTGLDGSNTVPLFVEAYVGENLTGFGLYHYSTSMSSATDANLTDGDYFYNDDTGIVVFKSLTFSPFTVVFNKDTWNNHAAESLVPKEGKYEIGTAEELALFAKEVNNENETFINASVSLTNNIDLGEYLWVPIGPNADASNKFKGTFDGQGYTISNLYVIQDAGYHAAGLFGALNGTVQNLIVDGSVIENLSAPSTAPENEGATDNGTAVVAGSIYNTGLINKVTVNNAKVNGNRYVGGVAGYVYGSVKNCIVKNTTLIAKPDNLTGSYDNGDKVGGIVGYFPKEDPNKIEKCSVENVRIVAFRDAGLIAGKADPSTVIECSFDNTSSAESLEWSDIYSDIESDYNNNIKNEAIGRAN